MHKEQRLFTRNRQGPAKLEPTITQHWKPKQQGQPRCHMSVYSSQAFGHVQCHAVGKVQDEDGYWWCGNHSAEFFDKKAAKRKAYWDGKKAEWNARDERHDRNKRTLEALVQAMRDIAAGHNDACALAREVLEAYDDARKPFQEGDTST